MTKSETELANIAAIIAAMPAAERAKCKNMIDSLLATVGHPINGPTFMIAIAHVNCMVAVTTQRLGLVDENGEPTNNYPKTEIEERRVRRSIGNVTAFVNSAAPVAVVPRGTQKRKAPWPDFANNDLFEGDTIKHPVSGETGRIFYDEMFMSEWSRWRVVYDEESQSSALALQIGDKGQAVKV